VQVGEIKIFLVFETVSSKHLALTGPYLKECLKKNFSIEFLPMFWLYLFKKIYIIVMEY